MYIYLNENVDRTQWNYTIYIYCMKHLVKHNKKYETLP